MFRQPELVRVDWFHLRVAKEVMSMMSRYVKFPFHRQCIDVAL